MKPQARTIYKCDFCTKHKLTQKGTENHERFCKKNPENKHRCFGCHHLNVTDGKGLDGRNCKQFDCAKLSISLYSYVAEKRHLLNWAIKPDAVRMPLECAAYTSDRRMIGDNAELPF